MKSAANLLLVHDGLVLAVSRRNDPTQWGLPGGKVDKHLLETNLRACVRETFEETGLYIFEDDVEPILSMRSVGDTDYWTTTYLYTGAPKNMENLQAEEGFFLSWKTLDQLADPKISPFAAYNKIVSQSYAEYIKG
jgi:8-oxo-dGTP pyrophosphatase MutT (NUDIX family)